MKYIKLFQEKHGLKNDGIIGKNTLNKFKEVYGTSDEQTAHLMGQTCHETGEFTKGVENLYYTAKGLLDTFKKYFTESTAKLYEKKPIAIGNLVYANRNGNGNVESGDGHKFKGRGSIMLTGKRNYMAFSLFVNDPLIMVNPDLVESKYFWETALFFFKTNNLMSLSQKIDEPTILKISKHVNGGYNGIKERILYTNKFYNILKSR